MAFVGFQTVAAAQYVVKYFNRTYFGSTKMCVEIAKSVNDVGMTINMRKKME